MASRMQLRGASPGL